MKLTRRGRGVAAAALTLVVLAILTWAAVRDATYVHAWAECPDHATCTTR